VVVVMVAVGFRPAGLYPPCGRRKWAAAQPEIGFCFFGACPAWHYTPWALCAGLLRCV